MFTVITKGNKVRQYHGVEYLHEVRKTENDYVIVNDTGEVEVYAGNPITWPTDAKNGLQAIVDVKDGTLRFGITNGVMGHTEFVVSEYVAPAEDSDPVNRPSHYTAGGIECIDAIKASMSTEAFLGFLKGSVQKYMWRYEKKVAPVEDLKKAQWYLSKLIEEQEQSC